MSKLQGHAMAWPSLVYHEAVFVYYLLEGTQEDFRLSDAQGFIRTSGHGPAMAGCPYMQGPQIPTEYQSVDRLHHPSYNNPMRKFSWLLFLGFVTCALVCAQPFSLPVKHHHVFGSCRGTLIIGEDGIQYQTANVKHQRDWKYKDIQKVLLLSSKDLALVTYEDRKLKLGGDRKVKFEIIQGELSKPIFHFLLQKAGKPIVAKIAYTETKADYLIPAKHLHVFGGCQGTLGVTAEGITYHTNAREESRTWRYEDIESIGPMDPFHLRVTANETSQFHYSGRKDFHFVLQQKLDARIYELIWDRVHTNLPAGLKSAP